MGREAKKPAGDSRAKGARRAKAPRRTGEAAGLEGFYARLFTAEELADLARAEAEPSLEDEIGLLRVAIRRGFSEGESLETVSRSVQRLAQALKAERQLRGQGIRNLEEALARVLDEIGSEIG